MVPKALPRGGLDMDVVRNFCPDVLEETTDLVKKVNMKKHSLGWRAKPA
jgi:hypothetical protein